jgi:hypothetical protein
MLSLVGRVGLQQRRVAPGPAAPAPENTALPAFLQPDGLGDFEAADAVDDNAGLFLDAGTWTGGAPPYVFDYAIYNAATDAVIVPRGNEDEVDLGAMTGLTIYGRVWCIDASLNEAFADTADFGPITAGFAATMIGRYDFRSTLAYVTSPPEVFAACGAAEAGSVAPDGSPSGAVAWSVFTDPAADGTNGMRAVSGDGSNWADIGASGATFSNRTTANGTTGAGARLAGRLSFSSSTAHLAIKVPNGWYRMRGAFGDPSSSVTGSLRGSVRNGPLSSDPELFTVETSGHSTSELVVLTESAGVTVAEPVAESTIISWINGGVNDGLWSAPFEITNGAIRFQRTPLADAGGGGFLVALDIKTAEAPL